jgi:hypothetical protein
METREVLLKADKVSVVFERLAEGKIRVTASSWNDHKVILPPSGARGGEHRQAGGAGPGGQVGGLSRHDDTGLGGSGLRPGNELM